MLRAHKREQSGKENSGPLGKGHHWLAYWTRVRKQQDPAQTSCWFSLKHQPCSQSPPLSSQTQASLKYGRSRSQFQWKKTTFRRSQGRAEGRFSLQIKKHRGNTEPRLCIPDQWLFKPRAFQFLEWLKQNWKVFLGFIFEWDVKFLNTLMNQREF